MDMRIKSVMTTLSTALPLGTLVALGGAAAYATNAYQGSDVSYTVSENARVKVCDNEADGHGVHTDAYTYTYSHDNSWGADYIRADDPDGAGGVCGVSQTTIGIEKHRTVEEISWQPDYKGDWSVHG
jgi:hypothetical protein